MPLGGGVWEFEYKDELLKSKICPNQHLDWSEHLRQQRPPLHPHLRTSSNQLPTILPDGCAGTTHRPPPLPVANTSLASTVLNSLHHHASTMHPVTPSDMGVGTESITNHDYLPHLPRTHHPQRHHNHLPLTTSPILHTAHLQGHAPTTGSINHRRLPKGASGSRSSNGEHSGLVS